MLKNLLALLIPFLLVDCCMVRDAHGQIKLDQTPVAPYQLWVGFVSPQVQADGTIKASVDSKPTSKTVQPDPKSILTLDEGYTLKDLKVEVKPSLDFADPVLTQIDNNRVEIKLPSGSYRAEAKLDFGGKEVIRRFNFTIGLTPTPDPGPGPKPDPTPTPTPDAVPNEYGLGKIAFANAPDAATAKAYAKIYKQAGDSLFGLNGQPLRSIDSDNPADKANPSRNVIAWLNQQLAGAKQEYRNAVAAAFKESQTKRQYTKADWYQAFNEIAAALEMVK